MEPIAIEHKNKKYVLTDKLASGDICDVYNCVVFNGTNEYPVVFKVVKQSADNDLVENEAKILGRLYPPTAKDEKFYRFLPRVLDSFLVPSQRRVNILPWFNEHRSLAEVLEAFPDGIDFRDMVWMFNRILHGIGFAHTNRIVHGALIPPHVLIHPTDHGAKIIDWSYAVDITPKKAKAKKGPTLYDYLTDDTFLSNPHVKAISAPYKDFYAPEILAKETPTAATDIYMAAKCAVALVGGNVSTNQMPDSVPKLVRDFLKTCLWSVPSKRPQDAWDAHEEFDGVLKRAIGKRKYRPFPMPERAV